MANWIMTLGDPVPCICNIGGECDTNCANRINRLEKIRPQLVVQAIEDVVSKPISGRDYRDRILIMLLRNKHGARESFIPEIQAEFRKIYNDMIKNATDRAYLNPLALGSLSESD